MKNTDFEKIHTQKTKVLNKKLINFLNTKGELPVELILEIQWFQQQQWFQFSALNESYKYFQHSIANAANIEILYPYIDGLLDSFEKSSKLLNWIFCTENFQEFLNYVDKDINLLNRVTEELSSRNNETLSYKKIKDSIELFRYIKGSIQQELDNQALILDTVNNFYREVNRAMDVIGTCWSMLKMHPKIKQTLQCFAQEVILGPLDYQGTAIQITKKLLEQESNEGLGGQTIEKAIKISLNELQFFEKFKTIREELFKLDTVRENL